MRTTKTAILLAALLGVGNLQAAETTSMEKIKTGILPSGGLYSLYEVSCADQGVASVASMQRGSRWCLQNAEEMSCFRRAAEALRLACDDRRVAAADEQLDTIDAFQ